MLALLLGLLLPALAAGPAGAADTPRGVGQCAPGLGIGLLQVPRATYKDPRARSYVIDSVRPGAVFSRDFEVCNGTTAPLPVQLYPDSATIVQGAFALAPGRGTNELTSWMTVTPASLVVPAGKAVRATVTFRVPADASAGEQYAGVVADAPPAATSGVAVAGRVGIRVYLDVSPGGAPKSDFTIDSLQAVRRADGSPAVLARLHNTGARALDMRGTLSLSHGPGGLSAGPFPAQLGTTLAPGDSAPVVVPLDRAISGGPWHAVISMTSGLLERRASGDITFPAAPATAGAVVRAKALPLYRDRGVLVPVASVLVGLLALLLLVVALTGWLRRRRVESPS
ncbi:MAG: peptidase [Mycobacteriales bacterium]